MKKKILLLIFSFFIGFIFFTNVSAADSHKITCIYRNKDNDNDRYELTFKVAGNRLNVDDCVHGTTSCMGDSYEHKFEYDVAIGSSDCPSSIEVKKVGTVTTIKWIENYAGQYVNSHQWNCLYKGNSAGTKSFRFSFEYWKGAYVVREAEYLTISDESDNPFSLLEQYLKGAMWASSSNVTRKKIDYDYTISNPNEGYKGDECPALAIYYEEAQGNTDLKLNAIEFGCENKSHCLQNIKASRLISYKANVKAEEIDYTNTCLDFTNSIDCRTSPDVACLWNKTKYGDYCNVDNLLYVRCGDAKDIPYQVPQIVSFAVNFLKILTPIILIVVSIISLLKALASSNEDEIKKAQKGLVRKIVAAVMVFLVITITQFVIMKVADSEIQSDENGKVETVNLSDCLNCLLNNDCSETVYYKTNIAGEYIETPVMQVDANQGEK